MIRSRMRRARSVQPSITRSSSAMPPVWLAVKFSSQRCCQPGRGDLGEPLGVGGPVVAHVDRRRRALEDVELPARPGEVRARTAPTVAPVPMMADALVGQLVHRRAERVAAGVVVVPAAGVERVALERLDAGDARAASARAAGRCPWPTNWAVNSSPRLVRMIQRARLVVPLEVGDLGVEQRVVVEAELLPDALAVLEDLRRVRVLLGRHVPGLLEQRHVHEATRCRTARRGSGSSTRCRRSRRPSR